MYIGIGIKELIDYYTIDDSLIFIAYLRVSFIDLIIIVFSTNISLLMLFTISWIAVILSEYGVTNDVSQDGPTSALFLSLYINHLSLFLSKFPPSCCCASNSNNQLMHADELVILAAHVKDIHELLNVYQKLVNIMTLFTIVLNLNYLIFVNMIITEKSYPMTLHWNMLLVIRN